jgi:glutathione S-transferase
MDVVYIHGLACEAGALEWNSVKTSIIIPRPLLTPLSGGYRRVPVAQIGADIYCDTRIIARALAQHAGDDTLYAHGFAATRVADAADDHLLRIMCALSFRPESIAGVFQPEGSISSGSALPGMEDFIKDRADYAGGVDVVGYKPAVAEGALLHWLTELEESIASGFLFGEKPSIADFSVYHPLWFLRRNPLNTALVEPYTNVMRWMDRIAAFGHGRAIPSDGEAALADAISSEPGAVAGTFSSVDAGPGDVVRITPTDNARVPVEGELAQADAQEFALRRTSDETGDIVIHLPRTGFSLEA